MEGNNCSRVWVDSLSTKVTSIPDRVTPNKTSSSNVDLTKYEQRIAQLENNQNLTESKIKSQNKLLEDHDDLVHEWIVLMLVRIAQETVLSKDPEWFEQQLKYLSKRTEVIRYQQNN